MDYHTIYVKHDSDNCECCLDFWLGPQTQAREKEELESDADSGYCSMTQSKELVPANNVPVIPRIIVTPLSDEEQIEHNACIRAALIQRNAFVCTVPSPSTTSLASLSNEEKAIPSSSSANSMRLSTISLRSWKSTTSRSSLAPPEESWSHRLKDTYENRMTWPQYFNIPTPHIITITTSSPSPKSSLPPSASSTSIFASALAAPHLRKRASKDALELHPKALAPISTTRSQSLRKRWSIAGSGVGFGFGSTSTSTSTSPAPRTKLDSNPTRPSRPAASSPAPAPSFSSKSPTPPASTITTVSESTYTFRRRSRATSTQSLNDKPSLVASSASPSPSASSLAPPSQPGSALGRWGRAINSATGGANSLGGAGTGTCTGSSGSGGGGGGGAFGKSMRSLKTLYSSAPSSFRML